jgi:Xaa-Pro aminopeptidase
MMDYSGRLAAFRERMSRMGVDLVYLTPGANMFYLTGMRRKLEHGTDHNAYGDWACGAYIGLQGGVTVLAPRMGGGFYQNEAAEKLWIAEVRLIMEPEQPLDVVRQTITALVGKPGRVALDDRAWAQQVLALEIMLPETHFSLASDLIMPMRMIKTEEELAAMRRASAIADLVFERTLPMLKAGVTEFEVAREVDYQFQLAGAEYTSFETGITFTGNSGPGPGTIRSGQRQLQPGDSITFDFGCVLDGYCSDFGRSAFLGEPSAEYLKVHATVLEAQAEAMKAMKAGQITASGANAIARKVIADAGYDAGFTHRLGHGIGVTVHEPPFMDGVDQTMMQANMLFTVEPSIRVPGRFANRVEDVVQVTVEGGVSLNAAPRELTVIS